MTKAPVGGARWLFVCLTLVRSIAVDKAAVISHVTPGSGIWNPEGSLCASCHLPGRGGFFPGAYRRRSHPTSPGQTPARAFLNIQGRPFPTSQDTSHLFASVLLGVSRIYIYILHRPGFLKHVVHFCFSLV